MKKSSRFTGLMLTLVGTMVLLNNLGKPRIEALHGVDIVGLLAAGGLLWDRLRWTAGQAETSEL